MKELQEYLKDYLPEWKNPYNNYGLTGSLIKRLLAYETIDQPAVQLRISRAYWSDRLDDIESGDLYKRVLTYGDSNFTISNAGATYHKYNIGEAYTMLYYIDALIKKVNS
jgi:hypothetical protein